MRRRCCRLLRGTFGMMGLMALLVGARRLDEVMGDDGDWKRE
jgi:hypothetical protein